MNKALLLIALLPLVALAQNNSEILKAHSDERRKVCDVFAEFGADAYRDFQSGVTLDQTYKTIEIEIADENLAYAIKLTGDIAYEYYEKQASVSALNIDLLHRCVTTSGVLDKAIASLWLETVPPSHPRYSFVQMTQSMTEEEIEELSLVGQQSADTRARLYSMLLESIPLSLEPFERRREGELTGCGVEFGLSGQDFAYKLGGVVFLRGSLMMMYAKQNLSTILKVIPYDMTFAEDFSTSDMQRFDISYAYLKTPNGNAFPIKESAFECEMGGLCALFPDEHFETVIGAMNEGNFAIVYTRVGGEADVEIPVVAERVDGYDQYLVNNVKCMGDLIEQLEKEGYGE